MLSVATDDGISVAVHHLGGDRALPPVLFSHATGFHGRCYQPVAAALSDRFSSYGIDHRGHGVTPVSPGWVVDWYRFGADAALVARHLQPDDGGVVGVGHSMGGAALLIAAAAHPDLFSRLILFEPIVPDFSPDGQRPVDMEQLPIVQGARRRRRRFDSIDDAIANYESKPPLSLMTPDALRAYVEHGFAPASDGDGVELRCEPDFEADVFVSSQHNRIWYELPEIETPTIVVAGRAVDDEPTDDDNIAVEEFREFLDSVNPEDFDA